MWQNAEERGHRGESSHRTTRHDDDDDYESLNIPPHADHTSNMSPCEMFMSEN